MLPTAAKGAEHFWRAEFMQGKSAAHRASLQQRRLAVTVDFKMHKFIYAKVMCY